MEAKCKPKKYDKDTPRDKQDLTEKYATSNCCRIDLRCGLANIGHRLNPKNDKMVTYMSAPRCMPVDNWRQVLCWKYQCLIYGAGGRMYSSIYDAMHAEKILYSCSQNNAYALIHLISSDKPMDSEADVPEVQACKLSDDAFLSQCNFTVNAPQWILVRGKLIYSYIRQRIERDRIYREILVKLMESGITPVLYYAHACKDTYFYAKIIRDERDTSYSRNKLAKKLKPSLEGTEEYEKRKKETVESLMESVSRNEIREKRYVGMNMYGNTMMEAIKDHITQTEGRNIIYTKRLNIQRQGDNDDKKTLVVPMKDISVYKKKKLSLRKGKSKERSRADARNDDEPYNPYNTNTRPKDQEDRDERMHQCSNPKQPTEVTRRTDQREKTKDSNSHRTLVSYKAGKETQYLEKDFNKTRERIKKDERRRKKQRLKAPRIEQVQGRARYHARVCENKFQTKTRLNTSKNTNVPKRRIKPDYQGPISLYTRSDFEKNNHIEAKATSTQIHSLPSVRTNTSAYTRRVDQERNADPLFVEARRLREIEKHQRLENTQTNKHNTTTFDHEVRLDNETIELIRDILDDTDEETQSRPISNWWDREPNAVFVEAERQVRTRMLYDALDRSR